MLPSVSCIEKTITAVITAEVATMPEKSAPATRRRTSPQAMQAIITTMSSRMRGCERRRAGSRMRNTSMPHKRISARPPARMKA